MKVGVIGHSGFVGSAFYRVFSQDRKYDVVGIGRGDYERVRKIHFDLLVNANGNSSKILAEKDPVTDFEMNVLSTLRFLRDFDYDHYLHVSTIEVYNDKSKPNTTAETAEIDSKALSNYGFSKYCAEQLVKRYAKSWMILRLGGMVGEGMKKGAAYDIVRLGKLFVSEMSEYQFMNTKKVAEIAKFLFEKNRFGEVYNVVGKGNIMLSKFAQNAKVELSSVGKDVQVFNINTEKLEKEMSIPTSGQTVMEFLKEKA